MTKTIALIGESCVGKSTIAAELAQRTGAKTYTGKDYLKLAKSEVQARAMFAEVLSEGGVIYVITEQEHLALLPPNVIRVVLTADLDVIKQRFAQRTNGNLPPPVAAMLEAKHGMFDDAKCNLRFHNADDVSAVCDKILSDLEN